MMTSDYAMLRKEFNDLKQRYAKVEKLFEESFHKQLQMTNHRDILQKRLNETMELLGHAHKKKSKVDLSTLSNDELIEEMNKRFVVPQYYDAECCRDTWNIKLKDFEQFKDCVDERRVYLDVDESMEYVVDFFKEQFTNYDLIECECECKCQCEKTCGAGEED
jgi:Glu-tRNA(Gln) amidotransferase subunit E-like FAD-binding protein